ncbi:L-threonylcarbamoyladenylate synthase [Thermovibrio sp.]
MKRIKKSLGSAEEVAELIKKGELVCSPTDTLYGLLGSALNEKAVEKVYQVKGREKSKPLIVLFSSLSEVEKFGVLIPEGFREGLKELFPAPVSVILPLKENSPLREVFKRANLAVRVPADEFLIKVIELSTPLFAPSANPSGKEPARDCKECFRYFKGKVPLCIKGKCEGKPSTLISLLKGKVEVLREGALSREKVLEVLGWKG